MLSTQLVPGEKARVISIHKGRGAERRMLEMGIVPGAEIEMLGKHPFHGPILLQVGNTRIALGRRMAEALEVETIKAQ